MKSNQRRNLERLAQLNRWIIREHRILRGPHGGLNNPFRRRFGDEELIFLSDFLVAQHFLFSLYLLVYILAAICRHKLKGGFWIPSLASVYALEEQCEEFLIKAVHESFGRSPKIDKD